MIKAQYCYPKRIEPNQTLVLEILYFMSLDLEMVIFKLTMKTNVALVMGSALHHESYEMALDIYVLFTSNYTQVARILEINKN